MSVDDWPAPEPLPTDEPIRPRVLLLPAARLPGIDELDPWLEDLAPERVHQLPGGDGPLYLSADGIAVTTTGVGKVDAATTVTALCSRPEIALGETILLTVGIAGGHPARVPLGSVVIADAVVDWDTKHRWDRPHDSAGAGSEDPERSDQAALIDRLAYRPREYHHELDRELVDRLLAAGEGVDLATDSSVRAAQERYALTSGDGPAVRTGTTVCGDEYWHGEGLATAVDWLCDTYGVGPYVTTQMEDAATVRVLERFGHHERYASLRAVANYDRTPPDAEPTESFEGSPAAIELALENLRRVGLAAIEALG